MRWIGFFTPDRMVTVLKPEASKITMKQVGPAKNKKSDPTKQIGPEKKKKKKKKTLRELKEEKTNCYFSVNTKQVITRAPDLRWR